MQITDPGPYWCSWRILDTLENGDSEEQMVDINQIMQEPFVNLYTIESEHFHPYKVFLLLIFRVNCLIFVARLSDKNRDNCIVRNFICNTNVTCNAKILTVKDVLKELLRQCQKYASN